MSSLVYHLKTFCRLFLLMSALSCPGTNSALSAQSTEEICRETQKVLEHYEKERGVIETTQLEKQREDYYRKRLQTLRKFIANNFQWAPKELQKISDDIRFTPPKEIEKMSKEETLVFQKQLRSAFEQYIQKLAETKMGDIEEQLEQVELQIQARQNRLKELNCAGTLEESEENISIAGTWSAYKWTYEIKQNGKTFSWKITNDEAYGEKADGEFIGKNRIKATWKNKNGTDTSEGTVIVKNGRVVGIEWDNHSVFTKSD